MKTFLALLITFCVIFIISAQPKLENSRDGSRISRKDRRNYPVKQLMSTGTVKWKFKTNGKVFSSPEIVKGTAVIGSEDGCLYAVDTKTGNQKWNFKTGGGVNSSPSVSGDRIFFGSFDGYYYALDINTGLQKWKFKTGGEKKIGGYAYRGMKPAEIYLDDLWDLFLSSPVADKRSRNATVYFGSSDSSFYPANKKVMGDFYLPGSIVSSPKIHEGVLYFGSADGYFYALNLNGEK